VNHSGWMALLNRSLRLTKVLRSVQRPLNGELTSLGPSKERTIHLDSIAEDCQG
jgi:hypothetical protein